MNKENTLKLIESIQQNTFNWGTPNMCIGAHVNRLVNSSEDDCLESHRSNVSEFLGITEAQAENLVYGRSLKGNELVDFFSYDCYEDSEAQRKIAVRYLKRFV
jgi:hypothetical protein